MGKITHFFPNISVAVVEVKKIIRQGDKIRIEGHGNEFEQKIASMQIEYKKVKEAKKGQSIGLKVKKSVKEGDLVYKV
ncbi:translation elongation factor-like protein [Candidatus Woesearchaeota archaeon]|nr:translation elongation factor-like protein [Candidatus Woesearchaeota archaeon]